MRILITTVVIAFLFNGCIQPGSTSQDAMVVGIQKPVYATGFEIQWLSDSSKKVIIYNPDQPGEVLQTIVWKPHQAGKVTCLSTTHLSFLDHLGCMEQVKGCGFPELVRNAHAVEAIRSGAIQNISRGYETNDEVVFSIMPDLFFVYPFGGEDPRRFLEKGIGCVQIAEYAEKHPLGRAEWIKVFGVFMHREAQADSVFQQIRSSYEGLVEKARALSNKKPKVFFGSYDAGNWFAPPSNSFAAQFIRDAGATYLFEGDTSTANIVIPAEEFMVKAPEIDFWGKLLASNQEVKAEDFTMGDHRFMHTQALQTGGLFYCNTQESDYHGDALLAPHHILADLIYIFHGVQFDQAHPIYFRKVPLE